MADHSHFRIQVIVFALVSASFTNIYITQPVLPVLQREFSVDLVRVSMSVSAVIFGIAVSNLPFGYLADRLPIQPIILAGGIMVAVGGLICAITTEIWVLIGARFLQGLFIPALTTCLVAYLAKALPAEGLNIVMGSYVSATVLGGLGGRLLGGLIHPVLNWRYGVALAAILVLAAALAALRGLPRGSLNTKTNGESIGYLALFKQGACVRIYLCALGGFFIFSIIFNYLPFRLNGPPFFFSTEKTTLLYLVYIAGIFTGPAAGRISNRFGSGLTMMGGGGLLALSLVLIVLPSVTAVVIGLLGTCAGFFTIHAAAVGALNRRLTSGQGRANALYVLFYYVGGWLGITSAGFAYKQGGWHAVIYMCGFVLLIPFIAGVCEHKNHECGTSPASGGP